MEKIPTAEEFRISLEVSIEQDLFNSDLHELMIEFARLHVKAALKKASEEATIKYSSFGDMDVEGIDYSSILNAYPDENIT